MCKASESKIQLLKLCKELGNCTLTERSYCECANFLFYTSWFEELLFTDEKRQYPDNDIQICADLVGESDEKHGIDLTVFDFFGDYFCDRYIQKNNEMHIATHHFSQLRLGDKYRDKVKESLVAYKVKKQRDKDLLFAYLMIAYRFRNNMFHGSKGLINIDAYTSQFEIINKFFFVLLQHIIRSGYKGYNQK